jgi:histone deacetylase complex regulatory component SIN3
MIAIHPHYFNQPTGTNGTDTNDPPPYIIMRQPASPVMDTNLWLEQLQQSHQPHPTPTTDSAPASTMAQMSDNQHHPFGSATTNNALLNYPFSNTNTALQDTDSSMVSNVNTGLTPPTMEEALAFLQHVHHRVEQGGKPTYYRRFKEIVRKHRSQTIKASQVAKQVNNLFCREFPDLVLAFNRFLPRRHWNSVDLTNGDLDAMANYNSKQ